MLIYFFFIGETNFKILILQSILVGTMIFLKLLFTNLLQFIVKSKNLKKILGGIIWLHVMIFKLVGVFQIKSYSSYLYIQLNTTRH